MAMIPSRRIRVLIIAAIFPAAGTAFPLPAQAPSLKGEFSLGLGVGFSRAEGNAVQRSAWPTGPLAGSTAENAFSLSSRAAVFFGGSYTRFFGPRLGIQAGFGYLKSRLETGTSFRRGGPAAAPLVRLSETPDPSEITAVPFYAAGAVRWENSSLGVVLTAGPAVILHSIVAKTEAGILSADNGFPAAYRVPVEIADQTWIALGAVFGAAVDLRTSAKTAVTFDVRYVLSPSRSFPWSWSPGQASEIDVPSSGVPLTADVAAAAAASTPRLRLSPSFLQISCALKFRLD